MNICIHCNTVNSTIELDIKPYTYVSGYKVEATGLDICTNCGSKFFSFYRIGELCSLIENLSFSCCMTDAVIIKYKNGWNIF